MERVLVLLMSALVIAVVGLGVVVHRAAEQAQDDQEELACLQRANATATIALLAPADVVDEEGRIKAIQTLSSQIDGC